MTGKNNTVRNFKIPKNCKDFPSDKLLLALENLLFYPPDNLPNLGEMEDTLIQKRFLVCQECEKIIDRIKEIYSLSTDKVAVNMAISSYLSK